MIQLLKRFVKTVLPAYVHEPTSEVLDVSVSTMLILGRFSAGREGTRHMSR
jgi:hypothetical protein